MDCEPAALNASRLADTVSPKRRSIAINLSGKLALIASRSGLDCRPLRPSNRPNARPDGEHSRKRRRDQHSIYKEFGLNCSEPLMVKRRGTNCPADGETME